MASLVNDWSPHPAAVGNSNERNDPNHRPLKVINFLAAHASEAFSLSEIARFLGLSKGSAHRVMTALGEAGFVSRHPRHKTYTLGMALVAIGQAALDRYPGITIARREIARLEAELGVGLGATAIVNDEYLLLAREGTPRTSDGLTLVGQRRIVTPPIGIGQFAWRGEAEIARYVEMARSRLPGVICKRLEEVMPIIRQRGFSMAANGVGLTRMIEATMVPDGSLPGDLIHSGKPNAYGEISPAEFQMLDWDEARGRGVNYMAAPVFSPESEVCLELVMSGFPEGATLADIERFAAKLLQSADSVTAEIRGRKPSAGARPS